MRGQAVQDIFQRLFDAYGPQKWWPAETPFEVIVGAILTQAAAWTNVEKAIANLKAAEVLSPHGIHHLPEEDLARLIYPSGYFNAKARKLKAFAGLLRERFDGSLERLLSAPPVELRELLLATYGIGPETADSILLYAAGKPFFVIDAYTRRTFRRLGIEPERDSYSAWQAVFHDNLAPDSPLFNQYHALILRHGKNICAVRPLCSNCPLVEVCPTGQRNPRKEEKTHFHKKQTRNVTLGS